MSPFWKWVADRAREQSTWTGIAALIATMNWWPESKEAADLVPHIGFIVIGIIKILLPENPPSVTKP